MATLRVRSSRPLFSEKLLSEVEASFMVRQIHAPMFLHFVPGNVVDAWANLVDGVW
jgi:hypothetical protein